MLRRNRHEIMQAEQFKHVAIDERSRAKPSQTKTKKNSTNEKIKKKKYRIERKFTKKANKQQ